VGGGVISRGSDISRGRGSDISNGRGGTRA
jgi:hypothetical protein